MKRVIALFSLALLGLGGAYEANAQYHNMGVQMDMVWPKGGGYTKDFSSLYGGFFYEYRFRGSDVDVSEFKDHFGIEFGVNYTEFIFKKSNFDLTKATNIEYFKSFFNVSQSGTTAKITTPYAKSSNKGANIYIAPKAYVEVYPDLVEMYLMGKVGFQYLDGKGSLQTASSIGSTSITTNQKNGSIYFGAALGFEVKLGTVFVGTNFGFDTNTPQSIMNKQEFKNPFDNSATARTFTPFSSMDKVWGNLILEFKVKALLNGD